MIKTEGSTKVLEINIFIGMMVLNPPDRLLVVKGFKDTVTVDWPLTVFYILLVVVPAYTANGMALIVGGGKPLDGGRNLRDGKRILGDGKTVRGTFLGILFGVLAALAISLAASPIYGNSLFQGCFLVGVTASMGAVSGDLLGSFAKRRFDIPSGYPVPLLDQLDFILMALLFAYLANLFWKVIVFTPTVTLTIVIVTPFVHIIGNLIVYKAGRKKHPW